MHSLPLDRVDVGHSVAEPAMGSTESRIHHWLDAAARRRSDSFAIRDGLRRWSYRDLDAASRRYAGWLKAHRVGPGDRIAVHAASDCRTVALIYACSRIGATFVPIGTMLRGREVRAIMHDSQPTIVLDDAAAVAAAEAETATLPLAADDSARAADSAISLTSAASPGPAMLIYTSGSTALPKGVVSPHEQVLFATHAIAGQLRYRADDVIFCRLPLSFDYGLYQIFLAAFAGAELVLADPAADVASLATIRRCGATIVPLVPSLATILLKLASRDRRPTRVRLFTNTGEELPQSTIAALRSRFPGAGIQLMFGVTECKRISIMEVDGDLSHPGSVGKPLPGTQVRILDSTGRPVPSGTVGEIVVSGPHVMDGYWRAPELSARVFVRDESAKRMLRTGDYGRLDDEGYLYFHGRRDDIFKINGIRTSTVEIEAAAYDIPGVQEAAVIPPTRDRNAILCVVADATAADILRRMRLCLDPLKVPGECRILPTLCRGPNGKIDRVALRTLLGIS